MSDYRLLVKAAEDVVAAVSDKKLKEVAFAQVLAHLLSSGKLPPGSRPSHKGKAKAKAQAQASQKKKAGTTAWLKELAEEGFFKTPRSLKAILEELSTHSHHLNGSDLTWPLQHLCHEKVLRRKKLAPAEGKPAVWHWSNW